MPTIHPTAIVSKEAVLADDVEIGPGCVLQGAVTLGAGCRLLGSVQLHGPITIGPGATIYPYACLGFPAQDLKFKLGMPTKGVKIGANATIREHATVHAATKDAPTTIGDHLFMMVASHVGHDAVVGNNVILVNSAVVGGHAVISDNATLSGLTAVHQFVRVGRLAFLSGGTVVSNDVPPFCVAWTRNRIGGINLVGLRRAGFPREHITAVREAFRQAFRGQGHLVRSEIVARLDELGKDCPPVKEMADFVRATTRTICPAQAPDRGED